MSLCNRCTSRFEDLPRNALHPRLPPERAPVCVMVEVLALPRTRSMTVSANAFRIFLAEVVLSVWDLAVNTDRSDVGEPPDLHAVSLRTRIDGPSADIVRGEAVAPDVQRL